MADDADRRLVSFGDLDRLGSSRQETIGRDVLHYATSAQTFHERDLRAHWQSHLGRESFLLIGLSFALMQWWPLLPFAMVVHIQLARGRREAVALREAVGEEYDRYRSRTCF